MERDEVAALGRDAGGVLGGKSAESFIDRSKVRILLCDNDPKSSEEVFTLLCKCSYQVTSVKSARQVIDALNAEGPDIDIILAEVDLPMAKGTKMLKYITRDKDLRRIPVIMMSAQDEVSVVVKCLRLGAADYLVKPLRTNELLNLWTHMWRRRRMLGLVEKNLTNYDIDLVASDPSDANTNSATLFSDDTDERSRKSAIQENCISTDDQEDEINEVERQVMSNAGTAAAPIGLPPMFSRDHRPDVPGISDRRTGQFASSCPKKSELRIGESSSAFFTYVKSSMPRSNTQEAIPCDEPETRNASTDNPPYFWAGQARLDSKGSGNKDTMQVHSDAQCCDKRESKDSHSQGDVLPRSNSIPDSFSMERSATPPTMMEYQQQSSKMEEFSRMQMHPSNMPHHQDVSGFHQHPGYPFYVPGMMNQVMMPQGQMFQKPPQDMPNHMPPSMFPQYGHLPHVPGMPPFPYYHHPVNMCMQQQGGQMPPTQPWAPSYSGNPSPAPEGQTGKIDRRVAALMKFRQKRKERCFDKKIRYVNRKKLAERRPRVRGQFVRKMNGINVDLNGEPASGDFDEDEEEEDDEELGGRDDSPDDDASMGLL